MSKRKIVGIIGGMGAMATSDLFHKIVINTDAKSDKDHIHTIIDNNTDIPDRTQAILKKGASPVKKLRESAQLLEQAGVDLIVMACNTSHHFFDEVQKSVQVPLLSMIKVTADAVLRRGFKKVALFATEGTVKSKMYHKVFDEMEVELILPDDSQQKIISETIYEVVKSSGLNGEHAESFQELVTFFEEQGAEACILACTELPLFIANKRIKGTFIDSSLELARAVIVQAGAKLKGDPSI